MKKLFFAVFAVGLVSSLCFAQTDRASGQGGSSSGTTKTFSGKISTITTGTSPIIKVLGTTGSSMNFTITTSTAISTKTGTPLNFPDLKVNDTVTVTYITVSPGSYKAQTIKVG